MKPLTALVLGACLLAVACGGPSLDDSITALQSSYDSGSYEQVLQEAPGILERCKSENAGDAQAWKVEKTRLLSLGKLGRGDEATDELARLDGEYQGKVKAELYAQVGNLVMNADEYTQAVTVLDAGAKKFVDKKAVFLPIIETCKTKATEAGDSAALDALKSLGYL